MVQRFKPGNDQPPEGGRNGSKTIIKKFKLSDDADRITSLPPKKNKGIEFTKAVKKPKAIDLSDVDDLISLPNMGNYAQPAGKPPPCLSQVSKALPNALPNYMKPTRSSGAKKDIKQASVLNGVQSTTCDKNQATTRNLKNPKPDTSGRCLVKTSSLKLGRNLTKSSSFKLTGSVKKSVPDTHAQIATCSSLIKDSKFPPYVTLDAEASESKGASSTEICTYKYCSLNGHHHAIVKPLRSFISDRRRLLKKKKSLKLEDAARQVPFFQENEGVDFCVDIYENVDLENNLVKTRFEVEGDDELYVSLWEAYENELREFEYIEALLEEEEVYIKIENEAEFGCISDSSFKGSVTVSEHVEKICFGDELLGCCQEDNESRNKDDFRRGEIDETFSYSEDSSDRIVAAAEDENACCAEEKENAADDQMETKCEMDQESVELEQNVFLSTAANADSETGTSDTKSNKCKAAAEEDSDSGKDFNPQEPNYLPLEPEPKAEQVDLKHQDIDERKNSEEWMVDYALRKTVTKLAPVKRKKVELLVEAYESVAPVTKRDNRAEASFPFASMRTIQACN